MICPIRSNVSHQYFTCPIFPANENVLVSDSTMFYLPYFSGKRKIIYCVLLAILKTCLSFALIFRQLKMHLFHVSPCFICPIFPASETMFHQLYFFPSLTFRSHRKETTASPSTVLRLLFCLGLRNAQHLEYGPKSMNGLMPVKARPRTRSCGRTVLCILELIWIQPLEPVSLILNLCHSPAPSVHHDASNSHVLFFPCFLFARSIRQWYQPHRSNVDFHDG